MKVIFKFALALIVSVIFTSQGKEEACPLTQTLGISEQSLQGHSLLAKSVSLGRISIGTRLTSLLSSISTELEAIPVAREPEEMSEASNRLQAIAVRVADVDSKQSAEPNSHLSKEDSSQLSGVISMLKERVFGSISDENVADAEDLASSYAMLKGCIDILNVSHDHGAAAVESSKGNHTTCRIAESSLQKDNISTFEALEGLVHLMPKPPPLPTWDATTDMSSYFSAQHTYMNWYNKQRAVYAAKKKAFDDASKAAEAKVEECTTVQNAFESHYCKYRTSLLTTCDSYASCYSDKSALYQNKSTTAKAKEQARKEMYSSGHRVICHVNVIMGKGTHADCNNLNISTHQFDLTYESLPTKANCDTSVVKHAPCDAEFLESKYGIMPNLTKAGACISCDGNITAAPGI